MGYNSEIYKIKPLNPIKLISWPLGTACQITNLLIKFLSIPVIDLPKSNAITACQYCAKHWHITGAVFFGSNGEIEVEISLTVRTLLVYYGHSADYYY